MTALIALPLLFLAASLELFFQIQAYRQELERYEFSNEAVKVSPYLQIKPKFNNEMHINDLSFRGDSLDLAPDTYRIFIFGGSSTFCSHLLYDDTYPKRLEDLLRAQYPEAKIQVQNAACDWYCSQHTLIRYLFEVRHDRPDLILVMDGINDLMRSFVPDHGSLSGEQFQSDYSHYLGALGSLTDNREIFFPFKRSLLWSKILNALRLRRFTFSHFLETPIEEGFERSTPAAIQTFKSLEPFESNLRLLAKLAADFNHSLFFLTQPTLYREDLTEEEKSILYLAPLHMTEKGHYPDLPSLAQGMSRFNNKIRLVGAETQTPVIDLENEVPKNADYFLDDVHPTAKATELEAQIIAKELIRRKVIDRWVEKKQAQPGNENRPNGGLLNR